jgi:hypothetical protein
LNGRGYEWDLQGSKPVTASAWISGASPQQLHLSWRLQLRGSGSVTATFHVKPGPAVAGAQPLQGAATLPYTCP